MQIAPPVTETEDDVMTALLDPTRRPAATRSFPAATPPTTALPPARRSATDAMRTAAMPSAASPETALTEAPARRRPGRGGVLLGAAVALAGAAAVVAVTVHVPLAPLAPAPVAPATSSSTCAGGTCEGLDPTTEGCQQDARTVTGRVVSAERRGVEVPVGVVELRASAACHAVWARYTLDPTAPISEVAVESRDGRSERAAVDAVAGHPHLGYGTTPMLTGSNDVRAAISPLPGAELPSRATAWTGAR
jgi:uncharacterized protein DUF2690